MSREKNPLSLRMPDALRDMVVADAKHNKRSINAEICFLLETALAGQEKPLNAYTDAELLSALLVRHNNEPIRIEIGVEKPGK